MNNIPNCSSITQEKECKSRKDCLFTATRKCRKLVISNRPINQSITPFYISNADFV